MAEKESDKSQDASAEQGDLPEKPAESIQPGEATPYEIEPVDARGASETAGEVGGGRDSGVAEAASGKVGDAGLLEDFDEDADFDRDPAVDAVIKGTVRIVEDDEEGEGEPLVKPHWPSPKVLAGAGLLLLLMAAVGAAVNATPPPGDAGAFSKVGVVVVAVVWVLYNAAVHTGTGLVAVFVAAHFTQRKFGSVEYAAGRMFVAVTGFLVPYSMNMIWQTKLEEIVIASLVYVGLLWVLMRLERSTLQLVMLSHFGIWLIMWIGASLSSAV